jgi:hypothetical protein
VSRVKFFSPSGSWLPLACMWHWRDALQSPVLVPCFSWALALPHRKDLVSFSTFVCGLQLLCHAALYSAFKNSKKF